MADALLAEREDDEVLVLQRLGCCDFRGHRVDLEAAREERARDQERGPAAELGDLRVARVDEVAALVAVLAVEDPRQLGRELEPEVVAEVGHVLAELVGVELLGLGACAQCEKRIF